MTSDLRVTDNVRIQVWDILPQGYRLAREWTTHNLATTAGKSMMATTSVRAGIGMCSFAVGTGTAATALTDTLLGAEVFRDVFTTVAENTPGTITITYFLGGGSANGVTLSEIGLFDNDTLNAVSLCFRALLTPVIVKTVSQAITFTWNIAFS